jgi:hypothetical protein
MRKYPLFEAEVLFLRYTHDNIDSSQVMGIPGMIALRQRTEHP